MALTADQIARLRQDAARALRNRDGAAALAALEPLTRMPDPPVLAMGQAHFLTGDTERAMERADAFLRTSPRHFGALMLKADCLLAHGDTRGATSFYSAALKEVEALASVPADVEAAAARAREEIARLSNRFEDDLRSHMVRASASGQLGTRMSEAVDILTGRRKLYFQDPQSFFFPGLPQIQFYERDRFDWVGESEEYTPAIRAELEAVIARTDPFSPYVESEPGRPAKRNAMVGDPRWGAYYLWQNGEPVAGQADLCPQTMAALGLPPIPRIRGRSPMALFSRLQPGMHILPHTGFLNTRLICHLPLVVTPGCRLRVGNATREWEEGKLLIFDDSIEHEAWNDGDGTRTVLLFEIWRPEITEEERQELTAMFEYIAAYST